jgi:undecaprenyl-phosphate galactose phosphotransferase
MVSFMPAMTQVPDATPRSIAAYGEIVSNWLRSPSTYIYGKRSGTTPNWPLGRKPEAVKRLLDVAGAALLLALMLPVLTMIAVLVWVSGGTPIYGHERVGRGGRRFLCWKVRTMVPGADARLEGILRRDPGRAAEWARDHKLRDDPRVTRLGRFLRRTSLDEAPQLWNILVGDMSLVGPRPVTPPELTRYGASARHYLAVRPGLTGLWQLDGRNDIPYARRVLLDRFYVMKPSIPRDLALLFRTPIAIARRTGR